MANSPVDPGPVPDFKVLESGMVNAEGTPHNEPVLEIPPLGQQSRSPSEPALGPNK